MLLRVVFNDLFILMSIVFHIPQQWVGAALTLMFACQRCWRPVILLTCVNGSLVSTYVFNLSRGDMFFPVNLNVRAWVWLFSHNCIETKSNFPVQSPRWLFEHVLRRCRALNHTKKLSSDRSNLLCTGTVALKCAVATLYISLFFLSLPQTRWLNPLWHTWVTFYWTG